MAKEVNNHIIIGLFSAIFIFCHSALFPQVSGSFGYSAFSDDNPARTTTGQSEFINSFAADLGLQLFNKEFYTTYSGAFSKYNTNKDMSFQLHSFGLNYAFNTGSDITDGEENIFTSINFSIKKGQGEYTDYDYLHASGFINGRFPLAETFFINAALYTSYKYYPSLAELTHFENVLSLQLSKFFDSGTGMFLDNSIGLMNYSYLVETINTYKGKGRHQFNSSNTASFDVLQLRTGLRISQSITDNTGISLRYLHRENLNDNRGMYLSSSYVYSGDDELWDDPFAFSGNEFSAELTQNLPEDIVVKISTEFSSRRYTNNPADSLNIKQRRDEKTTIWGGISKTFSDVLFLDSIELTLEYMYVKNFSIEEVFSYKNNLFMLGLQFGF